MAEPQRLNGDIRRRKIRLALFIPAENNEPWRHPRMGGRLAQKGDMTDRQRTDAQIIGGHGVPKEADRNCLGRHGSGRLSVPGIQLLNEGWS